MYLLVQCFGFYLQGLRTMTTCAPSLIRTLMQFSSVLILVDQRLWRMCLGRYADFKDICSSVWIVYTIVYKLFSWTVLGIFSQSLSLWWWEQKSRHLRQESNEWEKECVGGLWSFDYITWRANKSCLRWASESESLCAAECLVTSDVIWRQEVLREQELATRFGPLQSSLVLSLRWSVQL